tara:strand:- start:477 stop:1433 length:957 start_codon:yes stop_codon:yes gene_type:complete
VNILYIDAGGAVSEHNMYRYYGDLYRELREMTNVHTFQGSVSNISSLLAHIEQDIDCIIFGLGYFAQNNPSAFGKIEGLAEIKIPVACMLHKPQTMLDQKLEFCKINNVNLIVDSQCTYKDFEKQTGIKSMRLPFTATPKIFHPRNVEKKYDVGFSGALHGNGKISGPTKDLRVRIGDLLSAESCEVFWNSGNTLDYRIHSVEEYATKINECKIWLATTGPTEDVSPRYFEVMLSKTLLFCNNMPEQYEGIFQDGVNCVMFENDLSDFKEKLDYYLANEADRLRIVSNAYSMVVGGYTWKHMAKNLVKEIEELRCPFK